MFDKVWHFSLPITISSFMVRLLVDRFALASSLGRLGIHGPSKCFCCTESQFESLDHVISEGALARYLWDYFGNVAGVSYSTVGIRSQLSGWWCQPRQICRSDILKRVLPTLICWHVWKARNFAYFEGRCFHGLTICDCILVDLVGIVSGRGAGEVDGCVS